MTRSRRRASSGRDREAESRPRSSSGGRTASAAGPSSLRASDRAWSTATSAGTRARGRRGARPRIRGRGRRRRRRTSSLRPPRARSRCGGRAAGRPPGGIVERRRTSACTSASPVATAATWAARKKAIAHHAGAVAFADAAWMSASVEPPVASTAAAVANVDRTPRRAATSASKAAAISDAGPKARTASCSPRSAAASRGGRGTRAGSAGARRRARARTAQLGQVLVDVVSAVPQHPVDRGGERLPLLARFPHRAPAAGRQPVDPPAPSVAGAPRALDEPCPLQPMQRGVQRALVDAELSAAALGQPLASSSRAGRVGEHREQEPVQMSSQQVGGHASDDT